MMPWKGAALILASRFVKAWEFTKVCSLGVDAFRLGQVVQPLSTIAHPENMSSLYILYFGAASTA